VTERQLSHAEILALRATYDVSDTLEGRSLEPVSTSVFELTQRACKPSKCDCTGIKAGLFCGDGYYGCKKGRVYQCSGGAKSCMYGGVRTCNKCNKLKC
jgi:hypothetical protein